MTTSPTPWPVDRRVALAAIAAAPLAARAQPAPTTAGDDALVRRYAQRPLIEKAALSPDGRALAAIASNGRHTMLVTRVGGAAPRTVLSTDNLEIKLNWFRWVNARRLVLSVRFSSERPLGRARTLPTIETRLVAADIDGSNVVNLVRQRRHDIFAVASSNVQDRVVDWLPDDGQHVLLALQPAPSSIATGVYKVDVDTGSHSQVQAPREQITDWVTDTRHRVRVGVEFADGKTTLWVCNADGKDWRRLHTFGPLAADRMWPLGFGRDPDALFVTKAHEGRQAVHRLNLADPQAAPALVYAHPKHDLGGELVHDTRTGDAVGVRVRAEGSSSLYYWDAGTRGLAAAIDAALPDRVNELQQVLGDGATYLVRSHGNGIPAVYLIGDRKAGKLSPLAEEYEHLDPEKLPRKRVLTLRARDGLALPSFLTLPATKAAKAPHPLVVLPHGGPQAADSFVFEPLVCFIAELGCAVLQVNFRGSVGYGYDHLQRGLRRWGLEMQDDLTDAVEALVKEGTADRERIAIVGGSYGGYAALMGGIRTPQLYKGLFAIAPVTDLVELVAEAEREYFVGRADHIAVQVGTLQNDLERLRATSPRRQARAITVPVVLVHGTADSVVPFEHSEWMEAALREAGKEVRLVELERGDHQLSHVPHRERTYSELAAFLRRTLALKAATA